MKSFRFANPGTQCVHSDLGQPLHQDGRPVIKMGFRGGNLENKLYENRDVVNDCIQQQQKKT